MRRAVVIGALSVVFGDIGTSPIYTFRECLKSSGNAGNEAVLGLLSLVFWAVMVVVTIKYVCLVMRADNDGEGGIIALLGLPSAAVVDPTRAVRVRAWNASSCPKCILAGATKRAAQAAREGNSPEGRPLTTRAAISATGITWAVDIASMTRVA